MCFVIVTMLYKCCVPQCQSSSCNSNTFFRIPKATDLRKKWIAAIGLEPESFKASQRVCSRHFGNCDYYKYTTRAAFYLKRGVIPRFHLPKVNVPSASNEYSLSIHFKHYQYRKKSGIENHKNVLMLSVKHCTAKANDMDTITNSLEVFDTYKHREDKDSDEESFHLPLDDDETESKFQDVAKNGSCNNDSEDEILNKFETTVTGNSMEPTIDPLSEERLLDGDEACEKKSIRSKVKKSTLGSGHGGVKSTSKPTSGDSEAKTATESPNTNEKSAEKRDENKKTEVADTTAPIVVVFQTLSKTVEEDETSKTASTSMEVADDSVTPVEREQPSSRVEEMEVDEPEETQNETERDKLDEEVAKDEGSKEDPTMEVDENKTEARSMEDKSENSNDSTKNQIDDSEDLFDISAIRDAEEDNAESAYNEAHPEETEDCDDSRNNSDTDKQDNIEDDSTSDKNDQLEQEEVDIVENSFKGDSDEIKTDEVDIEELNLKLICDGAKDASSDVDSDNSNRRSVEAEETLVQDTESVDKSNSACVPDEGSAEVAGVADGQKGSTDQISETDKAVDSDEVNSEKRKSLKRTISDEIESNIAKKPKTVQENIAETEAKVKPKEKLPIKTLLHLTEFLQTKKGNKTSLTKQELEELCLQKICESIAHKSELGELQHQLKVQELTIESMRKDLLQLTKQTRDLEIVNKKLMNDLKQQTVTQKPLYPLKITRSVGLQVKFASAFEAALKRRQVGALAASPQKVPLQAPQTRSSRNIPNNFNNNVSKQVATPPKQPTTAKQTMTTPLLSQALQNRTASATNNRQTLQPLRPKAPESAKPATPSPSVIDLTDEDEKRDKSKAVAKTATPPKSITVPLRTTPVRVGAAPQSIRLTTAQAKGSPLASVVTSTSQVMYVVQSTQQNALGGSKAVVVNFQPTPNGMLTASALNGAAVSVIPKQNHTIQLKSVTSAKPAPPSGKLVKNGSKHPAPLPSPPVIRLNVDSKLLKPIPPKPHLTIRKTDTGIILQWRMPYDLEMYEVIASYQLYAYQETSAMPSTDMWRKVGDVKALALPMACTLTQFADKNKYYFAVRPVDIHKRIGVFSDPEEIAL